MNQQKAFISETRTLDGTNVHWVQVQPPDAKIGSPFRHAIDRARDLAALAKKSRLPLKLFMSGGIDSEAMAVAFLAAEISFTAVIGRYNQDMNQHDIVTAVAFCREHEIQIEYVDVDVYQFLEEGHHLQYARELGCRSPQIAVHLYMLDQVKGFPVLGGNPIYLGIKNPKEIIRSEASSAPLELSQIIGLPGQTHSVYLRYLEKRKRQGEPFFFQSSPELLFSFLYLDETLNAMARGEQIHDYAMKCRMYQDGGFAIEARADKYTGFEKYRSEYDRRLGTQYGTGFNIRFRTPLEEMTPELPQRTIIPLPVEMAERLHGKILNRLTVLKAEVPDHHLSRRRILTTAWAATAAAVTAWLLPLPANALACYPSCMSAFIGSAKMCENAMRSCGDIP